MEPSPRDVFTVVEPLNGSSFRSSTTLSSYMLLYKVSIICTWGYARDDRREVAPADKSLSYLNITEERAGRPCEDRPRRAACDLIATMAATLDNSREQTCALARHGGPKKCGPRQACARTTPLLMDETAGTES